MSVAAEYAAKLKRHVETAGEPGPTYRFTISYRDLTELVVAALELEQLKASGDIETFDTRLGKLSVLWPAGVGVPR
jgi:hypothetical protein